MQQPKTAKAAGNSAPAKSSVPKSKNSPEENAALATRGSRQATSAQNIKKSERSAATSAENPKTGKAGLSAKKSAPEDSKTVQENAVALLQRDHRTVEQLFKSYESAQSTGVKQELAQQICMELIVHAHLEEQIFYPACRENGVEDDTLDEAQVEHDGAKVMIAELLAGSPDDAFFDAKVKVLKEYIRHHVNEEEKADGIFSKARQASLDLDQLGTELKAMKEELTAEGDAVAAAPLEAPSLHLNNINQHSEETRMPRQSNYQDDEDDNRSSRSRNGNNRMRDDDGRFASDDDDGRSSRGRASRSSFEDDDNRSGRGRSAQGNSGRGQQGMDRDDQGRFMSDDDDDRSSRSRSGRSNYDDDDNNRGRNQNSRGRSTMDRDDQGRFMSDDDDDHRGGQSRSGGGRGQGGRFDESDEDGSRQRSQSGRSRSRSDEDDDNGGRGRGRGQGWFGESERHSEAARQQSQSGGNDDSDRGGRGRNQGGRSQSSGGRGQSSRSQSGRSSSSGHGGWHGDPEGHAAAARRGWRHRED